MREVPGVADLAAQPGFYIAGEVVGVRHRSGDNQRASGAARRVDGQVRPLLRGDPAEPDQVGSAEAQGLTPVVDAVADDGDVGQ